MGSQSKVIACNLEAIPLTQRDGHFKTLQQIQHNIQERQELVNGYAFRLPPDPAIGAKIIEYIALERRCCPFFTFVLEFEAEGGALWWKITGPEGSKEILAGMEP